MTEKRSIVDRNPWHLASTVVPALGDPRHERPPAVYGHFVNVPTPFNVKLPVISGHLPNADADSHLMVVSTCYNGQCKQMPRFRWSFQPKIACGHPHLRPSVLSKFPCCRLVTNEQYQRDATSSRVMDHVIAAIQPLHWLRLLYDTTSEKSRILFVQPAMSKNRTILSFYQRIEVQCRLGEAHYVERLLPSQCGKTQMARRPSMLSKQTGKAIVAYVKYKYSRTVGLQYISCYVALILGLLTIAYIVMTVRVFIRNIAGGDSRPLVCIIAMCIIFGVPRLPIRPCDERPPVVYGHFCLVPRVSVHDRYYCSRIRADIIFL